MQFSFAQEKTVTGTVSDDKGVLPGANVVVQGTSKGVQTDLDGKYAIKVKQGETLVYSFIGMQDQTRVVGASNSINVKLSTGNVKLEEVVVQGYRTVTKKSAVTAASTVNAKTIENRPNANAINTLQGQLAGVNITANTGQPGAKSSVVIRGVGTINGNTDPLYVIDGFPSNSDNFRSINPNDIASVDVLKDAAAISEFGSRGSNGVIVIKTRKGSYGEGKAKFRYSSQYGSTHLQTPKYSYANAKQLLKLEQIKGSGLGASLTDEQINAYNIDTDWVNVFFRPGITTGHNFSVESGSKNMNSFSSVSYYNQEGILETTGLKRFTLRNNLNGKSNNEKFNYTVNVGIGYSKNNQATNLGGGAINRNYVTGAFLGAPYISPDQYVDSFTLYNDYQADGTLLLTPLFLIDKLNTYANLTEEMRLNAVAEASYKISNNITARSRTSGELLSTRFFQSEFPDSFNALLFSSTVGVPTYQGGNFNGFEDINQRREFLINQLWQLAYSKNVKKHTFGVTANAEYNHSLLNVNNFRQRGLDPKFFVPNTGGLGYAVDTGANDFYVPTVAASKLRNDLISYFGSLDYDYNKKYGVVASYRLDGSSRFIKDNQFNSFWSVGARWNLDEEAFMDKLKFIDVLKLRGSIGTVGNQRIVDGSIYAGISPPGFADIYQGSANAYNNGTGFTISFGYPDLKWETTEQYNFGVDLEMFKSRLRANVDYYNRKTVDLYIDDPVTPGVGDFDDTIVKNTDAFVTNSGIELNIGYDIIRNNNTTLTIRANGSYNKNRIDGIKVNDGQLPDPANPNVVSNNGGMIDENYLYPYIGVNPDNGNLLFEDINGNPTETPTDADLRFTGKNRLPVYQGGFGFDFDYKGFFTSTTFTFAQKVWRYDIDLDNLYDPANIQQFNVTDDLLNAWTTPGQITDVPSITASNRAAGDQSDRFLRDASYIRLRNAQIGYKFSKKALERTFLSEVSITLQGENLFNITKWQGFDPESDRDFDVYQYPTPRLFTLGLDLKF
jgi:TonB-dependent starch-binding outer membrane protein SusC